MKQRIKRLFLLLSMAVCLALLTACGSQNVIDYNEVDPYIASQICEISEDLLGQISSYTGEQARQMETELRKQRENVLADGVASWVNVEKDTGAFIAPVWSETIMDDDGAYICTVYAQFENRNLEYKIYYDLGTMGLTPTSMSFTPEYTLGEKMQKALLNMVMGMGIVFVLLIFLSLLISCFKYIHLAEEKAHAENEPEGKGSDAVLADESAVLNAAAESAVLAEVSAAEEVTVDDLELIAVITAAVAAAEDTPADGLVVRSIRRADGSKRKRA